MNNQQLRSSAQLSPGWVEKHVPAPGSQRPYVGALSWGDDRSLYNEAATLRTPHTELARADADSLRGFTKLERLAR